MIRSESPTENRRAPSSRYHTAWAAAGCAPRRAPSGRASELARRHPTLLGLRPRPRTLLRGSAPHANLSVKASTPIHPVLTHATRIRAHEGRNRKQLRKPGENGPRMPEKGRSGAERLILRPGR